MGIYIVLKPAHVLEVIVSGEFTGWMWPKTHWGSSCSKATVSRLRGTLTYSPHICGSHTSKENMKALHPSSAVPSLWAAMEECWSPTLPRSLVPTLVVRFPCWGVFSKLPGLRGPGRGREVGAYCSSRTSLFVKKQKLVVNGTLLGLPCRQTNCIF